MAFGHQGATGEVRVLSYGVPRAAIRQHGASNLELAIDQMRRRNALWNRLVEIDRAIRAEQSPIVAPYRERGERVPAEVKAELRAIEERYRETINAACRESGCYWCNYGDVKIAWQQARRKPDPPRFHRWDGTGKTVVSIAHGLPVSDVWGDHGMLRLRPRGTKPGDAFVFLRVGSEGRAPVWLVLPVRLHRPLPEDGRIRAAWAIREVIAGRDRWTVQFVVERPAGAWRTSAAPRAGRIALDLGWRQRPGGMRVATWETDAGERGELVLPEWHQWAMQKVADLQSIRDQVWNQTIAALSAWVEERERVPEWLREAARVWGQWRRKSHLVHLWARWRGERFAGDEIGFAILETWLARDRHLWEWEANLRDQALRRRREFYRIFAAGLARRYAEVVLEQFDLREVARRKADADGEPGAATELLAVARRHRQWAAVHELRQAILNACQREGVTVTLVPARDTTVVCASCGSRETFDRRALRHRCRSCGTEWDQDENAARNLLRLAAA